MNNKTKMYDLGELFCGPGGFAEGARKTGFFKHVTFICKGYVHFCQKGGATTAQFGDMLRLKIAKGGLWKLL